MSFCVSFRLLFDGFLQFFGQINACLIGQTEEYPQHVGHLFAQGSLAVVGLSGV